MEKFKELSIDDVHEINGGFAHLGILVTLGMAAGAAGYAATAWAWETGVELGKSLAKQ